MLYQFLETNAWDFAYATREDLAKIARTLEINADTQVERMNRVCEELIFENPLSRRRALNKFTQVTSSQAEKDHLERIYQEIAACETLMEIFRENITEMFWIFCITALLSANKV